MDKPASIGVVIWAGDVPSKVCLEISPGKVGIFEIGKKIDIASSSSDDVDLSKAIESGHVRPAAPAAAKPASTPQTLQASPLLPPQIYDIYGRWAAQKKKEKEKEEEKKKLEDAKRQPQAPKPARPSVLPPGWKPRGGGHER